MGKNYSSAARPKEWGTVMGQVDLTIEQLSLDNENPRIDSASNQREGLQKVIADEPEKFVRLAKSLVKRGLNPMDRLLVFRPKGTRTYTVVEGNRRAAALKVLVNPASLSTLSIDNGLRKRLEDIARSFAAEKVEPIACFDIGSRENATHWLRLRHTGENEGEGVVGWKATAQSRFLGGEPALEALQFVKTYGELSDPELDKIERRFNLTTLRRLMESRPVRDRIGIDVTDGVIHSGLPAEELIKPLRRFVVEIANGELTSRKLHTIQDQANYVDGLNANSRPDLSKAGAIRPITEIAPTAGQSRKVKARPKAAPSPSDRPCLVPRNTRLNITDPKVGAIVTELQKLRVDTFPHAASILFRVFLELSTDHYMNANGLPAFIKIPNRANVDKKLGSKVREVVDHLISGGAKKKDFDGLSRALGDKQSPLSIDLLHGYVHNLFVIPKTRDLLASWDEARPYFEAIWA
jgi:vacuolar-type H+-ATPase subunit F/Vma7